MSDANLQRLLDVVQERLGGTEARVEFGGAPPTDPFVWAPFPGRTGWRLVVRFAEPPTDRTALTAELEQLLSAFAVTASSIDSPQGEVPSARALDLAIYDLASKTDAMAAIVIDGSSPVVWARSHTELDGTSVEDLLAIAKGELPAASPRVTCCAVAAAWLLGELEHEPPGTGVPRRLARTPSFGALAHVVNNIYWVLLAFEGPFNEVTADGVLRRSLRHLERLLTRLPPTEPPAKRARLVPVK